VPAYLQRFTAEERQSFTSSVAALHRFSSQSDDFLRQRSLTKIQAAYFKKYAVDWTQNWASLAQTVSGKISVRGSARELKLRPVSINLNAKQGQVVVLRRCLDQRSLRVFADGQQVPQPQLREPRNYRVTMLKRPSESWWRTGVPRQGATC